LRQSYDKGKKCFFNETAIPRVEDKETPPIKRCKRSTLIVVKKGFAPVLSLNFHLHISFTGEKLDAKIIFFRFPSHINKIKENENELLYEGGGV
jgi:hypothetical protein